MHSQRNKPTNARNNQSNTGAQKENEKSPKTKLKIIGHCDLNGREFQIAVKKRLSKRKHKLNKVKAQAQQDKRQHRKAVQ